MGSLSLIGLIGIILMTSGDARPQGARSRAIKSLLETFLDTRDLPSGRKAATEDWASRWSNKTVHYKIVGFGDDNRELILSSIAEWEKYTCLDFIEIMWDGQADNFITFQGGNLSSPCESELGMVGGPQDINLGNGCRNKPTVVHEIGHAIGFEHEQMRPDRDDHILVHLENASPDLWFNFDKLSNNEVNTMGIPYDYGSVMQYDRFSASANGKVVMQPTDTRWNDLMGHMTSLSFSDNKMANEFYECAADCGDISCAKYPDAYLDDSCTCQCRGWPVKACESDELKGPDLGPPGSCVYLNPNCARRADCVNPPHWVVENCFHTCQYCCDDPRNCTTVPVPPPCGNVARPYECRWYARDGDCTSPIHHEWMETNCRQACDFC